MEDLNKYISNKVEKLLSEIATEQKLLSGDIDTTDSLIIDSFKEVLIRLVKNNFSSRGYK